VGMDARARMSSKPRFWALTADVRILRDLLCSITLACRDPSTCASIRRNRNQLIVGIAWDSVLLEGVLIRRRAYWAPQTFWTTWSGSYGIDNTGTI
jgi:hypothetical protein